MNIASSLFEKCNPQAVAVIEKASSHTYGELQSWSSQVAQELRENHGVKPADRIGLLCADGFYYIAFSLGIIKADACFVPIAPELSELERKSLMETMHLHGIITGDSTSGMYRYERITIPSEPAWHQEFASMHPALIRFSSGTTGESKGVLLCNATLLERIMAANEGLQITPADRIVWVLSMSHHFAVSILLYLWNGATIVIPPTHFASDILESATENRSTVLYASPFHFFLLTSELEKISWPDLRLAVSTTSGLQADVGEKFAKATGIHPSQALGIIEAGLPFLNRIEPSKRPLSIGRPQPAFEAKIMGATNEPVEPGCLGNLFIKGPGFFDAYIAPWKKRHDVLYEGEWFDTGDIAVKDEEGFYQLQGRSKSVINIGGMKFFPEEVEAILCEHPDVQEARVSTREHPQFGSISFAEIVLANQKKLAASELLGFCRKRLARHKIPAEILFVEKIPKTPSGKILRR